MGNHFHDNNGWLIAGMDGHFGIHWPFVPMWFYSVNFMHPFTLGNKQKPTVLFNGVPSVAVQHEPKYLWPHIGIIPDPADLLTPLHIYFGNHRAWLPKVSVLTGGEPAAICAITAGISVNLDCWDFGHLPTSLVLNDGTVETTATWADYSAGLKTALVNLAIEGAIFLVTMGVLHVAGEALQGVLKGFAEEGEGALTDLTESLEEGLEGGERELGNAGEGPGEGAPGEETPGEASDPCEGKCTKEGEPVDVASGAVVDSQVDISLPGAFSFVWKRNYSSRRARQRTSLGRGGWTHSFEQWIEPGRQVLTLRSDDGRDIYFAPIRSGESTFHRQERLTLTARSDGSFTVYSLDSRLTRDFAPLVPGGRAVLRAIRDAYDNTIAVEYTGEKLRRIVDTAGREIRVKMDGGGRVLRLEVWVADSLELWFDYAYTERGELGSATNALGYAEHYGYDDDRRMVKKTLKNGVSFYYEYDDRTGWCILTWGDGEIHRVEFRPDLEAHTTVTGGNEEPRIYTWNDRGVVLREASPDGSFVRTRVYDDDLFLLAVENGAGERTSFEYDARGNQTKVIDPAKNITTWTYKHDLPLTRTDADGASTQFESDEHYKVVRIMFSNGDIYRFDHDAKGYLCSVCDDEGPILSFAYGGAPNSIMERDAFGDLTTFSHDGLGRPTTKTDAFGRVTRVEYDRIGAPVAIHHPDGTTLLAEYDAMGRVNRATDALGGTTTVVRVGTSSLSKVTFPDGSTWQFLATPRERLREVINPLGETYRFDYDQSGRVCKEQTFDGRWLLYEYSLAGRLTRITYPDHTRRELAYDVIGNVVGELSPDGALTFERDRRGRITCATSIEAGAVFVNSFKRDSRGRILEEIQGDRKIEYTYDISGRRASRTLPDGSLTRYSYNRLGHVATLEHCGVHVTFERDSSGREIGRHTASGSVAVTSAYNARGLLTEQHLLVQHENEREQRVAVQREFLYDAGGRVTKVDDSMRGEARYEYDEVGRLVEECSSHRHAVFTYDAADSLRAITSRLNEQSDAKRWATQRGNLLHQTDENRYAYDARGRRTQKISRDGEATEYSWDSRDRLRSVQLPTGEVVRFSYDAFGRRICKTLIAAEVNPVQESTRVTEFIWDGDAIAADAGLGIELRTFVHVPGTLLPVIQGEGGHVFVVVNDHLGTPQELVDAQSGVIAWAVTHSAWSAATRNVIEEANCTGSPFRLLGQYFDDETELCATRFRYFDANVARWLTADPLGMSGGRNLFSFNGAPTVDTDQLGLQSGIPFGFENADQFARFGSVIDEHLGGLVNYYEGYIQGSAATGFKYHEPGVPFGPTSDIDLAIVSKDLFETAAAETGADIRGFARTAPNPLPDILDPMRADLSEMLGGRDVNVMVFENRGEALDRATSIKVPKSCG